jgi:hypothetical protein
LTTRAGLPATTAYAGYVARHDRTRCDDRMRADRHTIEHDRARADPHVVADLDALRRHALRVDRLHRVGMVVAETQHAGVRTDSHTSAGAHVAADDRERIDCRLGTERHAIGHIRIAGDPRIVAEFDAFRVDSRQRRNIGARAETEPTRGHQPRVKPLLRGAFISGSVLPEAPGIEREAI